MSFNKYQYIPSALFSKLFIISIICCWLNRAIAQTYNFENFTVEDGLSQSQVLSLYQHTDGVLWIGTNGGGVTLYDGASFENITDKNGLAGNVVYSITNDAQGNIWLGTHKGVSKFDGKSFKNYTTANGLTSPYVFKVMPDSKGLVWVGTNHGISIIEDSTVHAFDDNPMLNNVAVFNIFEDSQGNYWFCTFNNGVTKYDGNNFKNYSVKGENFNHASSVIEIRDNVYWFTTKNGLYELRNDTLSIVESPYFGNTTYFYCSLIDHYGNIWLGSDLGVFKYADNGFTHYTVNNGLINDKIWTLIEDSEQNLWFGSLENGISKLRSERFIIFNTKNDLPDDNINTLFKSKNGKLWLGTKKGLSSYYHHQVNTYTKEDGLNEDEITALTEDKAGNLWIGSVYGVNSFDGKKFKIYFSEKDRRIETCNVLFIDSKGKIWLGMQRGIANIKESRIVYLDKAYNIDANVFDIYEDKQGVLWFATDEGLLSFNGQSIKRYTEKDGFIQSRVRSVISDKYENLWLATNEGIYKLKEDNFYKYSMKDGLNANAIHSIAFDSKGNLWAGLPNGINRLRFEQDSLAEVKYYSKEDGFLGKECNLNAIYIDTSDNVSFGTVGGITVYRPRFDHSHIKEPKTKIKAIRLFLQPTDWTFFADSVSDNNIPYNLILPYDRNHLTFDFVGVSLTMPHKVKYQYILKGYNKDWLPITSNNFAQYSNLPPHKYEFLVKASNGEGVWNKEPVTFSFVITPPFWETWWFYSICAFILAGGIYSYITIRMANKKIKAQKVLIEEKNKDIMDSIQYAKGIQDSILPTDELIKEYLPDSFVLFKPKDIVSGDFYWMDVIQQEDSSIRVIFTVADCTGHGVPGAFVSMVGANSLNKTIKEYGITKPAKILDKLTQLVEASFSKRRDGMDIVLCSLELKGNDTKQKTLNAKLQYAGANNPLYIVSSSMSHVSKQLNKPNLKHETLNLELFEVKADKQPIGAFEKRKPFTNHEINLQQGDTIYLFTDGYADQFGGPKGKKFKYKPFKKLLLSLQDKNMQEQKEILDQTINKWKGNLEQIDDICIIGVRI